MEPKKKQTRKSVPRPNSGRRAVDGATDLVKVGVRLSKEQHEWVKANGQHALRQLIQAHIDKEGAGISIASVGSMAEDVRAKVYV
jgi:ribosomal protein L16/L10AE